MGWDHGLAAAFGKPQPQLSGIVGTVGDQPGRGADALEQRAGTDKIMRLPWREREGARAAQLIGQRVNLGRPSAARSADGVREVPPFAPLAERCALTWVESIAADEITPLEPVRA